MSIFRDFFNVKQKPVFTGSRFGFGSGGGPTGPSFSITGGNVADGVAPGNGYIYHVFSSSGALTVSGGEATGCEWLLIGGGASGGGGDHYGGGGGAGGVVYKQNQDLTPGSYTVYIGSKGPGDNAQDGNPSFPSHNRVNTGQGGGEDSEFTIGGSTIYALGGGRGGKEPTWRSSEWIWRRMWWWRWCRLPRWSLSYRICRKHIPTKSKPRNP